MPKIKKKPKQKQKPLIRSKVLRHKLKAAQNHLRSKFRRTRKPLISLYRRIVKNGSPFRLVRKVFFMAIRPQAMVLRTLKARTIQQHLPALLKTPLQQLHTLGCARAGQELDYTLLEEIAREAENRYYTQNSGDLRKKKFWLHLLKDEDLQTNSRFVRFALQETVLQLISARLKTVPYLADIEIYASFGASDQPDLQWERSQRWHRDYNDTQIVKLFCYLSAVLGTEQGPFTYIPREPSTHINVGWRGRPVDDGFLAEQGVLQEKVEVLGDRLTSFYIDTANCYHCGSRCAPGELRLAYVATYITYEGLFPHDNRITINSSLTPLQQLALRK